MRLAVIGIGSPFGGDSLSWDLIERLRLQYPSSGSNAGELVMKAYDRPGLMLLEYLSGMDRAILVDAVAGTTEPAAWYALAEFACLSAPLSAHLLGCAEALAIGCELGGLPPFDILGLRLEETGTGDSCAVERGMSLLVARLCALGWPVNSDPELSHSCGSF